MTMYGKYGIYFDNETAQKAQGYWIINMYNKINI